MTSIPSHLSHPKYRPEIDGLRALAVLSVIGFHAFPNWVRGGFIGVDVFYVISGFLICTIIFESLDRGTFSFAEFYARRIKRIFPALIVVLIASYAFGWCALFADEYKQLSKHIAAGAGFVANLVFWGEAGYFDNTAETKPLLHLWSLGIEEQFYIVWPFFLWFAWKRKLNLLTITIVVALISFYLNINGIRKDGIATFYSPLTRFWELLCGSLLAWFSLHRRPHESDRKIVANVLSVLGLFFLVYGFFRINREVRFPGAWAVLPVSGAGLIIWAGPLSWLNHTILSNRLAVWFGLISYPLYLWHWPLLSFARIVGSGFPSRNSRIAAVLLSVILAWLTYQVVERRIRLGGYGGIKVATLVVVMAVIGVAGYETYSSDGLVFREVLKINWILGTANDGGDGENTINGCGVENEERTKLFAFCVHDKRPGIKYALMGDSKAAALFPGVIRTSSEGARWLFIGGPAPLIFTDAARERQAQNIAAVEALEKDSSLEKVVIVNSIRNIFQISDGVRSGNIATYDYKYLRNLRNINNYSRTFAGLSEVVSRLANSGKKIVLVVDNPALPNAKDCIVRKTSISFINRILVKQNPDCFVSLKLFNEEIAIYRKLLADVQALHPGMVEVFDPTEIYCDKQKAICPALKNGRLVYAYTDHLSDYAAGLVGVKLNQFLGQN